MKGLLLYSFILYYTIGPSIIFNNLFIKWANSYNINLFMISGAQLIYSHHIYFIGCAPDILIRR